jgi:hypothetical protein
LPAHQRLRLGGQLAALPPHGAAAPAHGAQSEHSERAKATGVRLPLTVSCGPDLTLPTAMAFRFRDS